MDGEDDATVSGTRLAVSRYAKRGAVSSMKVRVSDEAMMAHMVQGMKKLAAAKQVALPVGIPHAHEHPLLEPLLCWTVSLITGISERTSGGRYNTAVYIQVSVAKDVKLQAHKLALCSDLKVPYHRFEDSGHDVSHLCHNKKCWRPGHLAAEPHAANVARNSGVGCAGWLYDVSTKGLYRVCQHEPSCMHVRILPSFDAIKVLSWK
jgi:hypothetical protein